MERQFKIIVEKHPDGYVAYPLGLKGVVVGDEGDTCESALSDVKSAIRFHVETFGAEVFENESPVLEAFVAESLSGEPADYPIFMAIAKTVGKDRRGNTIYKRHKEGREVIRRDLYENYASSNVIDFAPIVETNGRIVDDDLPEIARLFVEEYKD